jgi:hypothetical protein
MREEAPTSAAGMGQEAIDHVRYPTTNAGSDFVQLEAAREIVKITGIAKEPEEQPVDQNPEPVAFQTIVAQRRADRAQLRAAGFDPDAVNTAQVQPGGFLPAIVLKQNAIVAARPAREAEAVDDPA